MRKECYINEDNNLQKISNWKKEISKIRKRSPFNISSKNIALLVLDMQDFFLNSKSHAYIPSSPWILRPISNFINFFSQNDLPMIFTRHISTMNKKDIMNKWWKDTILENNEYSLISNKINTYRGIIIKKNHYSAFYLTELERILKEKEVDQIIITGVFTNLCCETTARAAFMRNFKVFFAIDGTATYNEDLHLSSLKNLSHGFAICQPANELLKSLELCMNGEK